MRHTRSTLIAVVLVMPFGGRPVAAQCGDMNGDGFLSDDDFPLFALAVAGPDTPPGDPNALRGDLDGDGDVDLADVDRYAQLYSDNYHTYVGAPPRCAPLPHVEAQPKCIELGAPSPEIHVFVPTQLTSGGLELRIYREDDMAGFVEPWVYRATRPLSGAPVHVFTLPSNLFTTPGMYSAVAQLTRPGYGVVGRSGAPLGVRPPGLPQVPETICTFEVFSLDAAWLKSASASAAQQHTPLTLELGTRTYAVMLEDNNEILSAEIQWANPDVQLYRGFVVSDPTREVRVSFGGEMGTFAGILIDSEEPGRALNVEAAITYDASLPTDLYLGYLAEHAATPMGPHVDPPPPERAWPPAEAGSRADRIRVNVYYDWNDQNRSRFDILNRVDGVFNRRLGRSVVANTDTRLNTNNYRDPPNLLDDFAGDANTSTVGAHLAWLLSNNSGNISYGNTLGTAYWSRNAYVGAWAAYCWVKAAGTSTKCRQLASCHEMSHLLGASDTNSSHRDARTRQHTHGWWIFSYTHDHYSIMCSFFMVNDEERMDDRWLDLDVATLQRTIGDLPQNP